MPLSFNNHCDSCPYNNGRHLNDPERRSPLSKESHGSATLLVLQAPGIEEWNEQRPLISSSPHSAAARIRNALDRLRIGRDNFDITNSVQCFPGKSLTPPHRDKSPSQAARRACLNWLRADIQSGEYSRIVAFGRRAQKSLEDTGFPFVSVGHPSGGLSNADLDAVLDQ